MKLMVGWGEHKVVLDASGRRVYSLRERWLEFPIRFGSHIARLIWRKQNFCLFLFSIS